MSFSIESRPNSFPNASWHNGFGNDSKPPQAQQAFECLIQDAEDEPDCRLPLNEGFQGDMRYQFGGMSYEDAIATLRDNLEQGNFGQGSGETRYTTDKGLDGLRALHRMFGGDDMAIDQESNRPWRELFNKLDSAKRDKGLPVSDPARLESEDGRISREDLEAFIADIAEKRDNPNSDDPYYQWEDDVLTYASDLSSAWDDLGFGHTIGAEDIERLAGAAEAADVVKTGWWDDVVEHGGLSSEREDELDTAGPNNDEDSYADGVFSLRDFNAYIQDNQRIAEA